MARTLLILYSAMIAATVLLQLAFGGSVGDLFQSHWGAHGPALDIGLGVAVGIATVLLWRPVGRLAWAARLDRYLRELLAPLAPRHALAIALLGSLAEELLFRGFLQPRLGLWATALLFGVVHHVPHRRDLMVWPVAATVMGLIFGLLAASRGGIIAATVAHFTINYFNLHQLLAPGPDGAEGV